MSDAVITAAHPTHWEVQSLGATVVVYDVRDIDCDEDWLVFNAVGQSLPASNAVAAAAIAAVSGAG